LWDRDEFVGQRRICGIETNLWDRDEFVGQRNSSLDREKMALR
jgi:hypothetical protein